MTHHILSVTLILMHGVYIIFTYHFFFLGGEAYNRLGKGKGFGAGGKSVIPGYRVSFSMFVILNTRQDLLEYVSKNSGQEVDVSTMFQIRDPLICEVKISYLIKGAPSPSLV